MCFISKRLVKGENTTYYGTILGQLTQIQKSHIRFYMQILVNYSSF